MELEEFVTKVVSDLVKAIEASRVSAGRNVNFAAASSGSTVQFDIAVTAERSSDKSGRTGIKVLSIAEGGGQIAKGTKNATVTRVSFGIQIDNLTAAEQSVREQEAREYNKRNSVMNLT